MLAVFAVLLLLACTTVLLSQHQVYSIDPWSLYRYGLQKSCNDRFCSVKGGDKCSRLLDGNRMLFQHVTDPTDALWTDSSYYLNDVTAKYVPRWSSVFQADDTSVDGTFAERYKKVILAQGSRDTSAAAIAFQRFSTTPRVSGSLPWNELGYPKLRDFVQQATAGEQASLFGMDSSEASGNNGFVRQWISNGNGDIVISKDVAYFEKYELDFKAQGLAGILIAPGEWLDRSFIKNLHPDVARQFFGADGKFPLIPSIAWVAYKPSVTAKVTRTMYYKLASEVTSPSVSAISIGGLMFRTGGSAAPLSDDEMNLFEAIGLKDTMLSDAKSSEIQFMGKLDDGNELLSESDVPQLVSFQSVTYATSQGISALAWLVGDVDGDGREDLISPYNKGGKLCIVFFSATNNFAGVETCTQQTADANAWFAGDVDGDRKADLVQVYCNRGRLNIMVYSGASGFQQSRNGDTGQGCDNMQFLKGDFDGDKRMDIMHIKGNAARGYLTVQYYTAASGFSAVSSIGNDQLSRHLGLFIGDVDGDARDDLVQLLNCDNRLCIILYESRNAFRVRTIRTSSTASAVRFLLADIDNDDRMDLIQLYNDKSCPGGRYGRSCLDDVNVITYTAKSDFAVSGVSTKQATNALHFTTASIFGDGRQSVVQIQDCSGAVCIMFYNPVLNFDHYSFNTGVPSAAVAWVRADLDGNGQEEILQLQDVSGKLSITVHKAIVNTETYIVQFRSKPYCFQHYPSWRYPHRIRSLRSIALFLSLFHLCIMYSSIYF